MKRSEYTKDFLWAENLVKQHPTLFDLEKNFQNLKSFGHMPVSGNICFADIEDGVVTLYSDISKKQWNGFFDNSIFFSNSL